MAALQAAMEPAAAPMVFISHAGEQKIHLAAQLKQDLRLSGVTAFLDRDDLHLGDASEQKMKESVRSCQILIIILTRDWLKKKWTNDELHWALEQRRLSQPDEQPATPLIMTLYHGVSVDEVDNPFLTRDATDKEHERLGRIDAMRRAHRVGVAADLVFVRVNPVVDDVDPPFVHVKEAQHVGLGLL